ncbi:MAG TPA: YjbQ family protein [Acidimicrobiales bacterium]|nr:YjbQ family protein [Acidimicrobiales bacterium]
MPLTSPSRRGQTRRERRPPPGKGGAVERVELRIETGTRLVHDLTGPIGAFLAGRGDGLCNVFVPHATAGLALIETGAGSEEDLAAAIERLLPRSAPYRHRHGHPGHGADHLLPALLAPSLTLPVEAGRPLLGTWQSVVLVDPNADNRLRRVVLSYLGG